MLSSPPSERAVLPANAIPRLSGDGKPAGSRILKASNGQIATGLLGVTGVAASAIAPAVETAERLPGTSALTLILGGGPSDSLSDGQARTTLLIWAAGLLTLGGWRLVRTDANR